MIPTALIADDEPLLRAQLREQLATLWPSLDIVSEAADGADAIAQFEELLPDIVFLDIHMPVMSGLDVARMIGRGRKLPSGDFKRAQIVFVTAYDQYAVTAFERGAIDYVLKPFEADRLQETVTRLQERESVAASSDSDAEDALSIVIRQLTSAQRDYLNWIKASVGQTVRLIAVDEVLYFQSDEKYTRVVLTDAEVLIRKPIKELLEELDPKRFWQIHRATIVNTSAIAAVVRGQRDQADLRLKGRPETLTVSRNFTHLFKQM
ncbi:MAG: LytR/AlgR family response regulator transcription factor [Burkholderiales bacterium]|jgi:DNA-binding LytR/AlgR family response regulator|nr:LytTR family DNA-binding domain-containing protein [Nitrosomonadaceae bacterium]